MAATDIDVYKEWLGIPEADRPPDNYSLLRLVQFEDDADKIRAHYKKLNGHVRKYATGQYSVRSQELLNELARAMLCLTDAERKREYDESMGREFEAGEESTDREPMGAVLVKSGKISRDQLREAESFAEARGLTLRDAVVQMRLVDVETAQSALAQELGRSYVDLPLMKPDDETLDKLPRDVVRRHQVLPLFEDDGMILVACIDEPDTQLEDEVRLRYGSPIRVVLAAPDAVNRGIAKYYSAARAAKQAEAAAQVEAAQAEAKKKEKRKPAARPKPSKPAASASNSDRTTFAQLSPGEQKHRKQMGVIFILWAAIMGSLLDNFVLKGFYMKSLSLPAGGTYVLTIVAPLVVAIWVFRRYWR